MHPDVAADVPLEAALAGIRPAHESAAGMGIDSCVGKARRHARFGARGRKRPHRPKPVGAELLEVLRPRRADGHGADRARTHVTPGNEQLSPSVADAMLAESRGALSATIREAEATAGRADSAQLYREFGAGPWHEPTLPPEELWTVMGRTSPHRDQFGFYRVLPGEGELAETVLNARRADPGARGNFAILQYRKGEETVLSPVFRSAKGVHSEQLAEIWRAENQIPIEDLIAGYTEYSPCGPRGRNAADCRRLWGYYSNVGSDFKGYYSWFYDENGRAAKRLFLRSLATGK